MNFSKARATILASLILDTVLTASMLCAALTGVGWWHHHFQGQESPSTELINGTIFVGLWKSCQRIRSGDSEREQCFVYDSGSETFSSRIFDLDSIRYTLLTSLTLDGVSLVLASATCLAQSLGRTLFMIAGTSMLVLSAGILLLVGLIRATGATVLRPLWMDTLSVSTNHDMHFGWSVILAWISLGMQWLELAILFSFLLYTLACQHENTQKLKTLDIAIETKPWHEGAKLSRVRYKHHNLNRPSFSSKSHQEIKSKAADSGDSAYIIDVNENRSVHERRGRQVPAKLHQKPSFLQKESDKSNAILHEEEMQPEIYVRAIPVSLSGEIPNLNTIVEIATNDGAGGPSMTEANAPLGGLARTIGTLVSDVTDRQDSGIQQPGKGGPTMYPRNNPDCLRNIAPTTRLPWRKRGVPANHRTVSDNEIRQDGRNPVRIIKRVSVSAPNVLTYFSKLPAYYKDANGGDDPGLVVQDTGWQKRVASTIFLKQVVLRQDSNEAYEMERVIPLPVPDYA